MARKKKHKICPNCKGNGYLRALIEEGREEIISQCAVCKSQGEVDEKTNHLYITAGGFYRLQ